MANVDNEMIEEKQNLESQYKLDFALGVLSYSVIGVAVYSTNGNVLYANNLFVKNCGLPVCENENISIIGVNIIELFQNYEGSSIETIFLNAIKSNNPQNLRECKFLSLQNEERYCDTSMIPVVIADDEKYILHTVIDITEKILNRNLIKEREEELEAIINNISDEVLIIDKNGGYKYVSESFKKSLPSQTELLRSDDFFRHVAYFDTNGDLIKEEDIPSVKVPGSEKGLKHRIDIKKYFSIPSREFNGIPIYDEKGKIKETLYVCRDVSFIDKQHELLNYIIEHHDLGYFRLSYPDFNIVYANSKITRNLIRMDSLNGTVSDLVGLNFFWLMNYGHEKNEEIKEKIKDLIDKKISSCIFHRKIIIGGEERFFKAIYKPLFDVNNKAVELVVTTVEITNEVRSKKVFEEALRWQDEILINITHELKTPLSVLLSAAQMLQNYLKEGFAKLNIENFNKKICLIKKNCYRFVKVINNIYDASILDDGFLDLNLSNVNIVQIIEDLIQLTMPYIHKNGLTVLFNSNVKEKIIACDPERIERIMLNLLSNAIKFSNENSLIFVDIIDKGNTVEISVKDTGFGIEESYLQDVFKKYTQIDTSLSRQAGGIGLGLKIVKSLVELHGGQIMVESTLGKGSSFIFDLPVRIIEEENEKPYRKSIQEKIEMIRVEFSDIYSI